MERSFHSISRTGSSHIELEEWIGTFALHVLLMWMVILRLGTGDILVASRISRVSKAADASAKIAEDRRRLE